MSKIKPFLDYVAPDAVEAALTQADPDLHGEMRLLVSGVNALRGEGKERLSIIEINALNALMDYVAYTQKASHDVVCGIFLSRFNIPKIESLPIGLYTQAVGFIVDMKVVKCLH